MALNDKDEFLHALNEKDDGRFIKVANIVGHTMQYHPHGDASIADALVTLTNKRYLIEAKETLETSTLVIAQPHLDILNAG